MKFTILKSKILTSALALAMTIAMVPGAVMAEDTAPKALDYPSIGEPTAMEDPVVRDGWCSFTNGGINIAVSTDVEKLVFARLAGSDNVYQLVMTVNEDYFPKHFSMKISPQSTVTATNGAKFDYYNAPYGIVTMGTQASTLTIRNGNSEVIIECPAPYGEATVGEGPVAYLPGYGQFANEGVNAGGWGDAYTNATAGRKAMMNAISPTGISLGSFGGYAIFDFGTNGVANDPNNKYGVDFIVYGNAFVGNAEPGGIQVSQDGNTWYNIAGSRHYADSTVWDYTVTHTNMVPADDDIQGTSEGQPYAQTYTAVTKSKARPNSAVVDGTYQIQYNTWHQHNWFPLYGNYFKIRKGGELPLANQALASAFATYTPKTATAASKLELKGTKIDFTSMSGNDYTFGYCDVHPNGNTPGVASNPYTAVAGTAGGDGIDISWAVNANGEPVNLDNIRYVRIYTGVMKDNPPFGETSTEVCGVYNVTPQAAAVGVTDTEISFGEMSEEDFLDRDYATVETVSRNTKMYTIPVNEGLGDVEINVAANAGAKVFINGVQTTSAVLPCNSGVAYMQIIVQDGDKEPTITLLKVLE